MAIKAKVRLSEFLMEKSAYNSLVESVTGITVNNNTAAKPNKNEMGKVMSQSGTWRRKPSMLLVRSDCTKYRKLTMFFASVSAKK